MKDSSEFKMKDEILAGIDITMRYLGSGELSKSGATDDEIARVIHDIHCLYAQRKNSIKKAREVVVLIDSQRINVYTKDALVDEVLLSFPLTQIRDVTACVGQEPYSKTCVLVAKGTHDPLYKAHLFYTKSEQRAVKFYQTTSLAFQIGYKLLEKFSTCTESASEDVMVGCNEAVAEIKESKRNVDHFTRCESLKDVYDREDIISSSLQERNHGVKGNNRTATVRIPTKNISATWNKENEFMNIDIGESNKLNQSKLAIYIETVEERSRFLLARWFRNSYRKFQKISGEDSSEKNEEDGLMR